MVVFQTSGESDRLSSSEENRHAERAARLQVAREARQITALAGWPDLRILEETLCKSVGIEKLIWPPEGATHAREHRRAHTYAILSMQGKCTVEDLAQLSTESSRSSQQKAQEVAAMYWNNLKV